MDFNLTDEQRMLRDGAQRFVREHYEFERRRHLARSAGGFSDEHWRLFAELGWLALPLPEDAGGFGADFVDTVVLSTELGRGLVLEPFVSSAVLAARIIDRGGADHHRQAVLPAIAAGGRRLALAYLEPARRYDPAPGTTTATIDPAGWRLTGSKLMVLDAPAADSFIVTARLPDGIGLFLVPAASPGLEIRPYPLVDGGRAADLRFDGVVVADDALLAGSDRAAAILEEALDRAALVQVGEALGAMESVIEITADYIKTRRQFGQPIGKFQALQHRMAEMLVKVEDCRSMLYRGLSLIDAAPDQRRAAVSAARVVADEAGAFIAAEGIQLHGGIGVTDEYRVSHYFKRLFVLAKSYGDTDWHMARYTGLLSVDY